MVLAEFKLKYAGSALGYVWSVVKPLALFTVLYLVFGRIFKLGAISHYYGRLAADRDRALHVLLRRDDARAWSSLVARESLLRKLRFPADRSSRRPRR